MAIISLGSVTIVAMFLWVLVTAIEAFRPLKNAKFGLATMYAICVLWEFGVTV
jgi:hypothetical protein